MNPFLKLIYFSIAGMQLKQSWTLMEIKCTGWLQLKWGFPKAVN